MNKINVFKQLLLGAVVIGLITTPAYAADVGMSISIGQPGFYGHLDIGDYPYPQPRLIYRDPIVIHRHAVIEYEPLYLRVPPGHAKRWSRYCGRYDACDRPVYFVNDRWYQDVYVPNYRERHGDQYNDRDQGRGYDRGDQGGGERGNRNEGRGNQGRGHGNGRDRD